MVYRSLLLVLFLGLLSCGNEKRASPPQRTDGVVDGVRITLKYGAPSVRGRVIFGDLVPYGKLWRTGANENTTVSFSEDVWIDGQALSAGSYGLFTTPGKEGWKVHFNEETEAWGAYEYDAEKDRVVIDVVPDELQEVQEQLRFRIADKAIVLEWERTQVRIPVSASP